jgi:hypothetical protein
MESTAIKGIWEEKLTDDVTLIFDTTRSPQRITIQKRGENPTHLEHEVIGEKHIMRARSVAREAYNIVQP